MGEPAGSLRLALEAELGCNVDWDGDSSFARLGIDSLMLMELIAVVEDWADGCLPDTLVDSIESVRELADWGAVTAANQRSDGSPT